MQKHILFRSKSGNSGGVLRARVFFAWVRILNKYSNTGFFIYSFDLKMFLFISCSQLYVALSRVRSPQNLKLFQPQESKSGKTINVVYREVL